MQLKELKMTPTSHTSHAHSAAELLGFLSD